MSLNSSPSPLPFSTPERVPWRASDPICHDGRPSGLHISLFEETKVQPTTLAENFDSSDVYFCQFPLESGRIPHSVEWMSEDGRSRAWDSTGAFDQSSIEGIDTSRLPPWQRDSERESVMSIPKLQVIADTLEFRLEPSFAPLPAFSQPEGCSVAPLLSKLSIKDSHADSLVNIATVPSPTAVPHTAAPPTDPTIVNQVASCQRYMEDLAIIHSALYRQLCSMSGHPVHSEEEPQQSTSTRDLSTQLQGLEASLKVLHGGANEQLALAVRANELKLERDIQLCRLQAALKASEERELALEAANAYLAEELESLQASDYHHSGKRRTKKSKALTLKEGKESLCKLMNSKHLVKYDSIDIQLPENPNIRLSAAVHKSRSGQGVNVVLPEEALQIPAEPLLGAGMHYGAKVRSRSYQPYPGALALTNLTNLQSKPPGS